MKLNVATELPPVFTHEGGKASRISPVQELRRSIMACLLWEKTFYEDGASIAERIASLVSQVQPTVAADIAIDARDVGKLRHAPLWIGAALAGGSPEARRAVSRLLPRIIQRPDEMGEFIAMLSKASAGKKRKGGGIMLSAQVKKGLADTFGKFNEYQLAKWNRDADIKLLDVLRLVHPKPKDQAQADLWKRLRDDKLASPETWENRLSRGEDKKMVFTEMLQAEPGKGLGYMALLMNLRNMQAAGIDSAIVEPQLVGRAKGSKALPFRFISAARAVPAWEPMIDRAMVAAIEGMPKMAGKTVLLVDVSGSMDGKMSEKGDLTRMDAASALAVLANGICESVAIYTFSAHMAIVPPRSGMALVDAIKNSQPHAGTYIGAALTTAFEREKDVSRYIVITDEQAHDNITDPPHGVKGYIVNVSTNKNGIGYGPWTHVDGFSEGMISYIAANEGLARQESETE